MSAEQDMIGRGGPDPLAALAELADGSVRVRWTPALEALLADAVEREADLECGRRVVRILRTDTRTLRVRVPCETVVHDRALVIVAGESAPRWISRCRILGGFETAEEAEARRLGHRLRVARRRSEKRKAP